MFSIFYKKTLLSTIIPVFNSAEYLEICLDSVCGQALDEHEIIVVDDNSTDDSPNILNRYREIYPFIKIIKNKATSGPGFSRNVALGMAKGKYITFVDSDDYLGARYFESLINCADANSSDIVFSDYKFAGEDTSRSRIFPCEKGQLNIKRHLLGNAVNAPWAKLYSSRFIKKNGLKFHNSAFVGEDIPFTWLSHVLSEEVDFKKNAVYFYRLNPAGCDKIVDRRILGLLDALDATRIAYSAMRKDQEYDEFLVSLLLGNIHYNFEKFQASKGADALMGEYLAQSKRLFSDIPKRLVVNNDRLSEQQKAFYKRHMDDGH